MKRPSATVICRTEPHCRTWEVLFRYEAADEWLLNNLMYMLIRKKHALHLGATLMLEYVYEKGDKKAVSATAPAQELMKLIQNL
jgi:hypothetical protein